MLPEEYTVQTPVRIDLQLFSAEDEGRTEPGSERRRKEEREKGNTPRSQELPGSLVLIIGVIAMYFLGNHFFTNALAILTKYFTNLKQYEQFSAESFARLFRVASGDIFTLIAPMLVVTFTTAIVGNLFQVGLMFNPKAIAFNPSKITPNFKKVLPTRQTIFNLIKSFAKVILIGWVSYIIISMDFLHMLLAGNMGIKGALHLLFSTSFKIFFVIGIILFIIGIIDYFYNKYEFEENLKVSPSEAKREQKESEGDKSMLNRRRNMVREFIRKGMLQKVKTADVVIVNPTHFSVALVYDPMIHDAPVVVAKGMDEFALMIRRVARSNEIPMVEDRLQARMLYDEAEIDMPIPIKFYRAISLIIARLDKFKRVA